MSFSEPSPIPCDSDPRLHPSYLTTLILRGYLATFLIISGLIGNVLIILILQQRQMRARVNQSLVMLAIWDICLLTSGLVLYSYTAFAHGGLPNSGNIVYTYLILFPLSNAAKTGSVWTVLVTAIERYVAIAYPLKHKYLVTESRIRKVLIITGLFAVVYCIPRTLEITVMTAFCADGTFENGTNVSDIHYVDQPIRPAITSTPLRHNTVYYMCFYVVLNSIFLSIGPFTLQVLLAIRTSLYVKNSFGQNQDSNNRRSIMNRKNKERNMTMMFFVVQLKYLACFVLPVALNVAELFLSDTTKDGNKFFVIVTISDVCVVAHSALNFPIYTIFTQNFRTNLKLYFLGKLKDHSSIAYVNNSSLSQRVLQSEVTPLNHHHVDEDRQKANEQAHHSSKGDELLEMCEEGSSNDDISQNRRKFTSVSIYQ